jgi:hypothetical protein
MKGKGQKDGRKERRKERWTEGRKKGHLGECRKLKGRKEPSSNEDNSAEGMNE